jgi:sulfatase modifying factor 1
VKGLVRRLLLAVTLSAPACGGNGEVAPSAESGIDAFETGETADTIAPVDSGEPGDALDSETASESDASDAGCPADMVAVASFCIDRYEAPNMAGEKPLAMQTAPDGDAWCKTRGKRLCTEAEWVRACQGASKRPYPYGTTYVRGTCTDDKTWISPNWTVLGSWPSTAAKTEAARLYQADPSGSRAGCVAEEGAIDLTGNVAEWVVRSFDHPPNNYEHVMKGCYWAGCYGGSPPSCGFVNPAHPGTFRTYEGGFRCCK